jgi:3-oxoacyl-[acyl-carrier protein] reductase
VTTEFTGRVALVTGSAGGIGAAIMGALAGRGAIVHGVDRDTCDVADRAQVAELVARLGPIEILVNCAGGVCGQVGKPIEDVSDADWRAIVDANLTTTFVCTRAVVPGMKAARYGRIVNITSGEGRSVSLKGIQAYASAKAAQIGFTRQTAHELGPFGITVNSIAPGFVPSNPSSLRQWEAYGPERQGQLLAQIPVGRLGTPEDVARGVLFLAAESAGWVTGQVLAIDGGYTTF